MENVVKEENDALKAYYESFGEKWKSTDELNKSGFVKQIEERGKNSRIRVVDVFNVNDGDYYVAKIYGGLNGRGDWSDYLEDIKSIINFTPSYIIKLDVDVPDDVWTLYIGIHVVKE